LVSKIAYISHPDYAKHYATYDHPESPDRTRIINEEIENSRLRKYIDLFQAEPAPVEHIVEVHPPGYLERLKEACENGNFWFDYEDTFINRYSYDTAILSAGGCLNGVSLLLSGKYERAFCSVRPPGHHAEKEKGMGFCLFNNAAISARFAQKRFGIEKIMIIDWDVHHGNGTQQDPSVFYISIHEHPTFIFPGTGRRWETGKGKGKGFTLNIPMGPGSGDNEYIDVFHGNIVPYIKLFKPELIIISAGFDAHIEDPLGDMNVTERGFREMTELIVNHSSDCSGGKILSILEGGYNLEALRKSVIHHLAGMIRGRKEEICLSEDE
jgi:acetoin utilization deacetylase AcuC-like enzyme